MPTYLDPPTFSTAARAGTRAALGITDQAGGTATFNGTGAQTAFTIAHGLGVTPTRRSVTAGSAAAAAAFYVTADATNLTVTFTAAPAAGVGNVVLAWTAGT